MAATNAAPTPGPPPLASCVASCVSPHQTYLAMVTDNTGASTSNCLFYNQQGQLHFVLENKQKVLGGTKVLRGAAGNELMAGKQSAVSQSKWTFSSPDGSCELFKTKAIAGRVKIGINLFLGGGGGGGGGAATYTALPTPTLQGVTMFQDNGKRCERTPAFEAAFGSNVRTGIVSTLVQNWSYLVTLAPGADAALCCVALQIMTELFELRSAAFVFN